MSADGAHEIILPLTGKTIRAADLFCGAGGTSTGARRAIHQLGGKMKLVAVNHWQIAIDTHTRMHPEATHLCADLEHVRPRIAVPGGVLDLLMASPTCTYHSRARGGRPVHDQQRMDPWHVVRWCSDLRVHRLLVENVPEMVDWGPCNAQTGKPIKSRKGEYFRAWLAALEAIGFKLDWRILVCADYGDATTRQRFFLIGRSDKKPLRWPDPSHVEGGETDLLGTRLPWRAAAEIIDWLHLGKSIFTRKKQLVPNTLTRLHAGAQRNHWPRRYIEALADLLAGRVPRLDLTPEEAAEIAQQLGVPLVMAIGSDGAARPTTEPCPTIVTGAAPHFVLPLIAPYYGGGSGLTAKGAGEALDAITTKARFGMASPTLVSLRGTASDQLPGSAGSVDHPVPAITASGTHAGVASPVLIQTDQTSGGARPRGVDEPIGAVVSKQNMGLAMPFMVPSFGEARDQAPRTHDIGAPVPAITATGHIQLAAPFVFPLTHQGDARTYPIGDPLRTITGANRGELGLAQPALISYRIEILYRMLHWRELARAMSFDDNGEAYDFAGTATEITKQIGNAVPGRTAKALVRALMGGT